MRLIQPMMRAMLLSQRMFLQAMLRLTGVLAEDRVARGALAGGVFVAAVALAAARLAGVATAGMVSAAASSAWSAALDSSDLADVRRFGFEDDSSPFASDIVFCRQWGRVYVQLRSA